MLFSSQTTISAFVPSQISKGAAKKIGYSFSVQSINTLCTNSRHLSFRLGVQIMVAPCINLLGAFLHTKQNAHSSLSKCYNRFRMKNSVAGVKRPLSRQKHRKYYSMCFYGFSSFRQPHLIHLASMEDPCNSRYLAVLNGSGWPPGRTSGWLPQDDQRCHI